MVNDLLAGHSDAFVDVHAAAMLSLVTDSAAVDITADTIPETLLFDVHRLSLLQHEFHRIVGCATVLTIATHAIIGSDKAPSLEKQLLISELVRCVSSSEEVFDANEFFNNNSSAANGDGVLTIDAVTKDKLLKALALSTGNKDDPVRQLMCVVVVFSQNVFDFL